MITYVEEHKFFKAEIGDKVFLTCYSFIIPVKIIELCNVHLTTDDKTLWSFETKDRKYHSVDTGMENTMGWPIWKEEEGIPDLPLMNQFIVVNWPIGHSIQIGENCFQTLEEARKYICISSKRKLGRRLRKDRTDSMAFIASTWDSRKTNKHICLRRFKQANPDWNTLYHLRKVYTKKA